MMNGIIHLKKYAALFVEILVFQNEIQIPIYVFEKVMRMRKYRISTFINEIEI